MRKNIKSFKYRFIDKTGRITIKTIEVDTRKKPILANYFDNLEARKKRQQGYFVKMIADHKFVNGGIKNG